MTLNARLVAHRAQQRVRLPQTACRYHASDNLLIIISLHADYLQPELTGAGQCSKQILHPGPHGQHRAGQNVEAARAQTNLAVAHVDAVGLSVDVCALLGRLEVLLVPVEFGLERRGFSVLFEKRLGRFLAHLQARVWPVDCEQRAAFVALGGIGGWQEWHERNGEHRYPVAVLHLVRQVEALRQMAVARLLVRNVDGVWRTFPVHFESLVPGQAALDKHCVHFNASLRLGAGIKDVEFGVLPKDGLVVVVGAEIKDTHVPFACALGLEDHGS